jgi:hypothetical protein
MSQQIIAPDLTKIDTKQQFNLGDTHVKPDGSTYRYMQADGAVTAKNLYSYTPGTWQIDAPVDVGVTPADAKGCPVCVWDGSNTALGDNEYAWVFVGPGTFTTITAGDVGAAAICYGHATAGLIDDAATAILLKGVTAPAAITGAVAGTFYAALPLYAEDLP